MHHVPRYSRSPAAVRCRRSSARSIAITGSRGSGPDEDVPAQRASRLAGETFSLWSTAWPEYPPVRPLRGQVHSRPPDLAHMLKVLARNLVGTSLRYKPAEVVNTQVSGPDGRE